MIEILEKALNIKKTKKKNATHFVLCNKGKIRYLIALKYGKKRLILNISSYSRKLSLLMKMLNIIPFDILRILKIGYFAKVDFNKEIEDYYKKITNEIFEHKNVYWNMIVGTYDNKQKLVIQSFNDNEKAIYFKIGDKNSNKEMISEIEFLSKKNTFKSFDIPKLLSSQKINENNKFNIQVTQEFNGKKVTPILNDKVYEIFKEILSSKEIKIIDGIPYTFSHGDFAPWNLKMKDGKYILFDWEHCGIKFYGFDLIHFIFQIENLLNKKSEKNALDVAVKLLLDYEKKNIKLDENKLKKMYIEEIKNEYKRIIKIEGEF